MVKKLNNKLIIGLTGILALLMISSSGPVYASVNHYEGTFTEGRKYLIYSGGNPAHWDFNGFYFNYTYIGANTVHINDTVDWAELDQYDAIFIPGTQDWEAGALDAINAWADRDAEKLLWVAGDSDFGGYELANKTNLVLAAVGSGLRLDGGSIEDPQSNDDAPYRVVANETGPDYNDVFSGLTWTHTIFHGPTAVNYFDGSKYHDLRNMTTPAGISLLINSSKAAIALDADLSLRGDDVYAYADNSGSYPMLAMETFDTSGTNKTYVVVGGEVSFSDYKNMYGNTFEKGKPGPNHLGAQMVDLILIHAFTGTLQSADIFTETETQTETETETETETDTVSVTTTATEVSTVTTAGTVTSTFTETKTDTPINVIAPIAALSMVAAVFFLRRRR
jgi:hypothetical protein